MLALGIAAHWRLLHGDIHELLQLSTGAPV